MNSPKPPPKRAVYALGADTAERQRLRLQSEELRSHSAALLDRVHAAAGWNVIDLGCGPAGVLDLVSARVGPKGRVLGLDYDPTNVGLARELVRELNLTNVEVVEGDARRTGLPDSSFDLVHVRTLLVNLPEPGRVVAEMVRLARPGGWVAALEPDVNNTICHPTIPEWERMQDIFKESFRADGADPLIGRRLGQLFWDAGLTEVGIEPRAEAYPAGHSRRMIRADLLRSMRTKIVGRGQVTESELLDIDRAVRAHLENPRTLLMQLFFIAWGRKPTT